ncbi:ras di-ras and rheb family members of small gtpase superfamily [Anaeramoeba flamelloides]|uniref:Ras di-ras and rheb family members of small gtpase superfamily n=1 Tax=Anaeramoeba flamelloides TaxID=1746091 RepID=A0AAV7YN80_9EUKA|nr:ras di-ras and rheb family members of small gtpase superfamily [Anaeramoeba flamelloides]
MSETVKIQIGVLGQLGSGKTSTVKKLISGKYSERYTPVLEDKFQKELLINEKNYLLDILDTAGNESCWRIKNSIIKKSNIFVMLYSIADRSSYRFLVDQEYHEILRGVKEDHPYSLVLVGNKKDLENERQVSTTEGEEFANKIGAFFFESSAKNDDLVPIFERIVTINLIETANGLPQDLQEDLGILFEKQILIDYQFEIDNEKRKIGCHRIFLEQRLGEEHFENLKQILYNLSFEKAKFVLKCCYCGLNKANRTKWEEIMENSKVEIPTALFVRTKILHDLNEMLKGQTHDLCLIVENEEMYFHKIFLIARFGYFANFFSKKKNKEIEKLTDKTGISLKIWKILRIYIYNGEIIDGIDDTKSYKELLKALKILKVHPNFNLKKHFAEKFPENDDCCLM